MYILISLTKQQKSTKQKYAKQKSIPNFMFIAFKKEKKRTQMVSCSYFLFFFLSFTLL